MKHPIDFSTEAHVRAAATSLRQRHDAFAWDAQIDDLIEREGLTQLVFSPWLVDSSLVRAVSGLGKKVQAAMSVKDNLILLAHDLPAPKGPFAKGHELGHSVLEWHRDVLYACDEHDLNHSTRIQMEYEANLFSSEALLPSSLVDTIYSEYPLGMETVLQLNSFSGASIESCAHRFVERNPHPCALLTLARESAPDGAMTLRLLGKRVSKAAVRSSLGSILWDQIFQSDHALLQNATKCTVTRTEITIKKERFVADLFDNSYKVLALLFRQ